MIDLYFAATPNGWKVSIMLEEVGLPYRLMPVRLDLGDQTTGVFRTISPNGRIPAIVDHNAPEAPLAIFESGAILLYLAEKTQKLLPADLPGRFAAIQWVMWQMAGLGPMAGQHGHFLLYAPEAIPYAIERFGREVRRLYAVLDRQLSRSGDYVAGDYSIADIACFPWIMTHKKQGLSLADYPHLRQWYTRVRARDTVQKGLSRGGPAVDPETLSASARARLFGYEDPRAC